MACTVTDCFLYGGITTEADSSSRLVTGYNGPAGLRLYISSQFYQLTLNGNSGHWDRLENTVSTSAYLYVILVVLADTILPFLFINLVSMTI